jgi:hypothetical protein
MEAILLWIAVAVLVMWLSCHVEMLLIARLMRRCGYEVSAERHLFAVTLRGWNEDEGRSARVSLKMIPSRRH